MNNKFRNYLIICSLLLLGFSACKKDENNLEESKSSLNTPSNYEFSRNDSSSVSYLGQTDRLNQITELANKISTANTGTQISATDLLDMYANTGGNGNGNFSFSSGKQLENKTFAADITYFKALLTECADASIAAAANTTATDGQAGLLQRSSGKIILVSDSGYEFSQFFKKGMMGALIFYQIANVYTTDDKIGNQVDNTNLVSGENYTAMEHHLDEAFGYYGAPIDFKSNYSGNGDPLYWAGYGEEVNANTGAIDKLMTAYKNAREAIVEKKYDLRDENVEIINTELEKLVASAAIHELNGALSANNDGDRLHSLSEMYGFVKALRYANPKYGKYTLAQIDTLIENNLGTNLWKITTQGLNNIKTELSNTYNLNAIKDIL